MYMNIRRHRWREALVTSTSTCKQLEKEVNNKHILSHISATKCRNIYITIHVWTSEWINNNKKEIKSTKLYTDTLTSKKVLSDRKTIVQNANPKERK